MLKLSKNAYMLEIGEPGNVVYPVLLAGENSLALVDTGHPGELALFVAAIEDAGFRAQDLTHILITHQDIDHVGCAKQLKALAPGCEIFAHPLEAPYISGEKTPLKLAALVEKGNALSPEEARACEMLKAGFAASAVAVDRLVEDGEALEIAGGVTAILTPGHTPGHLCFLVGDLLISGDALRAGPGGLAPPTARYTQNMAEALDSLKKLEGRGVKQVASYHGGYWRGDDFDRRLLAVVESRP